MAVQERLFSGQNLSQALDAHSAQTVRAGVDSLPEADLIGRPEDTLVDELTQAALVEPLILATEPESMRPREVELDMGPSTLHYGGRASGPGLEISADYPFVGEADLLRFQPPLFMLSSLFGAVRGSLLVITITFPGASPQPDEVRAAFEHRIADIHRYLDSANGEVAKYNSQVREQVRAALIQRKQRVLAKRNLMGAIGFPLKARDDATQPVPITRKVLGVHRQTSDSKKPRRTYEDEARIEDSAYEEIVNVIKNTLLQFERSPRLLASADEEWIRDHLLISLNGVFEGQATGETFNAAGKTDIMVREGNRHVFIGEVKWWSGAKAFGDAIDQLLSYLPWRDSKGALVVFIDRKDATHVIETADRSVRSHLQFVRDGAPSSDPTARRNYVLAHPDDPDREIKTAVLFAVIHKREISGT